MREQQTELGEARWRCNAKCGTLHGVSQTMQAIRALSKTTVENTQCQPQLRQRQEKRMRTLLRERVESARKGENLCVVCPVKSDWLALAWSAQYV